MKKISRYILYIPLIALALVYAKYSISSLFLDKECYEIVSVLHLGEPITKFLVHLIFPLDGTVALLLLFGTRIRHFPWHLLFLWAGLWPWVPRLLQWYGGLEIEYTEAAIISVLAAIAYYLHRTHGITLFRRRK